MLNDDFLMGIVGGYSEDCFWRCVAYMSGGGYSESDAEALANSFFGDSKDLSSEGAGVTDAEMRNFQRANFGNYSGTILQFTPPSGGKHIAVALNKDSDGNWEVFDPQNGNYYTVPASLVSGPLSFGGSGSGSGSFSGSGSY